MTFELHLVLPKGCSLILWNFPCLFLITFTATLHANAECNSEMRLNWLHGMLPFLFFQFPMFPPCALRPQLGLRCRANLQTAELSSIYRSARLFCTAKYDVRTSIFNMSVSSLSPTAAADNPRNLLILVTCCFQCILEGWQLNADDERLYSCRRFQFSNAPTPLELSLFPKPVGTTAKTSSRKQITRRMHSICSSFRESYLKYLRASANAVENSSSLKPRFVFVFF